MSYQEEQIQNLRITINREFPKLNESLKEYTRELKVQNMLKLIELDVFTSEEKKEILINLKNQYKKSSTIKKR